MRNSAEYSVTWRHTSVAGDMLVSRQSARSIRESRWHRELYIFVLDRVYFSVKGVIFYPKCVNYFKKGDMNYD